MIGARPAGFGRRAAVVTGAGGGLGRAVAEALLADGMNVSVVARPPNATPQARVTYGDGVHVIAADVANTADCDRIIDEAAARWGKVDVLINCAAVLHRVDLFAVTESDFAHVINTNLRSVLWLCRAALPAMAERNWGRVVNVTSVGVHTGGYSSTSAIYECTKAAVHSLTKTLAREFASTGILINSVAPGAMRTRMMLQGTSRLLLEKIQADIPLGRLAEPAEVAELVAFLASDKNTYATGASFDVNGGMVMI